VDVRADETTRPTVDGSGGDGAAIALAGVGQVHRVGRYALLELLGHGGMGVVFAAYDEELDRKVAIKFVGAGGDPRARAALLGEAQALARLAHPNVVHVYEVGEAGERVFIAMEFVRGSTLRQWLQTPRGWAEVVGLFVQAGRGLAAAHQAGLVHCDFKPDNALVGADGRVRVVDFGLARAVGAVAAATDEAQPLGGTPGYVPPEQYARLPVDARSDQFSFCVALFEALHGQRPFAGESPAALMHHTLKGEVRKVAGEGRLPARLRRAVARGLAVDPAARHPSMAALLGELAEVLPRPRSRWWFAAFASAAVTSGVWAAFVRGEDPAAVCAAAVEEEVAALWGAEPRAAVAAAFTATGLAYAGDSYERTARLLGAHVDGWATLRRRSCTLAADSPGARCLERHRLALAAWVDALRGADATAVEHAVAATAELADPRTCVAPAGLLGADDPDVAPERAAAAAEVEGLLARGRALAQAGQYERARGPVDAALALALSRGLDRLAAAALVRRGLLHEHTGAGAEAGADFAAAYFTAEAAGQRGARAEAAVHLVHVTGGPPRSREEDALWTRIAGSIVAGLGEGALDLQAALLQHRSRAEIAGRRPEAARADLEEALALETRRLGAEHPAIAEIHEQLGEALLLVGRADEALAQHARAIAVAEATLGPEHPSSARRRLGRGQAHERRGDLEAALADDLRALAVWERAYGEHPRLIWPLTCAGRVLRKLGRVAEAEPHYARAVAIAERAHGADHPEVARALVELGDVVRAQGRVAEARALHGRALTVLAGHAVDAVDAVTWSDLGEALLADGDLERAAESFSRAGAGADVGERARAEFGLARALWPAEPERARGLAERALVGFREAEQEPVAAAVEAWLAGRGRAVSPR
jgi:tetratricopeptide (TPR) repeat protein/predicted Ser/Thr protein kinase